MDFRHGGKRRRERGHLCRQRGELKLKDPAGQEHAFHYGGAGVGVGAGLKLPKFGKIELRPKQLGKAIAGTVGPESFPNTGSVYMTDFFKGTELAITDFRGICLFVDGGLGLIAGYSVTAMLLGIDPAMAVMQVTSPIMSLFLGRATPKAFVLFRGPNVGIQAGGGVAGFVGYLG